MPSLVFGDGQEASVLVGSFSKLPDDVEGDARFLLMKPGGVVEEENMIPPFVLERVD